LVRKQIPERGDIFHVNLDPSIGREQAGPHYAVIISNRDYNAVSSLPFVAPVTTVGNASRMAGFAVSLTGSGVSITGVIQVDQIKPMDLRARGATPKNEKVPRIIMDEVIDRFGAIFDLVAVD
jgi:mRNA-degrading endonuclease toxin of MazEF toxin-antitoxin module